MVTSQVHGTASSYYEGTTLVGGKRVAYRLHSSQIDANGKSYPRTQSNINETSINEKSADLNLLLVGVLSSPWSGMTRDAIRRTWANDSRGDQPRNTNRTTSLNGPWGTTHPYKPSQVLFVVGGPWTDELALEFEQHQDLLWVDREESYRSITWKVLVMLAVAQAYVRHERESNKHATAN